MGNERRCSCLAGFIGNPPACRPECVVSSECPPLLACLKNRCVDPCRGTCGVQAQCRVINHNPICSCLAGFTGDPFTRCTPAPISVTPTPPPLPPPLTATPKPPSSTLPPIAETTVKVDDVIVPQTEKPYVTPRPEVVIPQPPAPPPDPCVPYPCGANALCHPQGNYHVCKCLPGYFGNPELGCGPECVLDTDCQRNLACVKQKCVDPCPGACALSAECKVINHEARCFCPPGMTGDPKERCAREPIAKYPPCKSCHKTSYFE